MRYEVIAVPLLSIYSKGEKDTIATNELQMHLNKHGK